MRLRECLGRHPGTRRHLAAGRRPDRHTEPLALQRTGGDEEGDGQTGTPWVSVMKRKALTSGSDEE